MSCSLASKMRLDEVIFIKLLNNFTIFVSKHIITYNDVFAPPIPNPDLGYLPRVHGKAVNIQLFTQILTTRLP